MQQSSDSYLLQNDESSDFPFGKFLLPLKDHIIKKFVMMVGLTPLAPLALLNNCFTF